MANPAKKLSQGVLQKRVMADADSNDFVRARVIRWVGASAFFEVLNGAVQTGAIDAYLVKGGFAVELRNPRAARTSEDIDVCITGKVDAVALLESILPATWDSFEFRIKSKEQREHAVRAYVQVVFNDVHWCTLALDVLDGDISQVEHVDNVDITKYELPRAGRVAVMSRSQQMSEWIHCITKPAENGKRTNRARNLIDIFVFNEFMPCDDAEVLAQCKATFEREAKHDWPPVIDFPAAWIGEIAERLEEMDLEVDADALAEDVANYIARLSGDTQPRPPIDQFRDQVAAAVEAMLAPAAAKYKFEGGVWFDDPLSITIGENGGRPFVAYVAKPSGALGHRSNAFPFAFDAAGVEQAAAFIVSCLQDPYLH